MYSPQLYRFRRRSSGGNFNSPHDRVVSSLNSELLGCVGALHSSAALRYTRSKRLQPASTYPAVYSKRSNSPNTSRGNTCSCAQVMGKETPAAPTRSRYLCSRNIVLASISLTLALVVRSHYAGSYIVCSSSAIYTASESSPTAECMLVRDDRILSVGARSRLNLFLVLRSTGLRGIP